MYSDHAKLMLNNVLFAVLLTYSISGFSTGQTSRLSVSSSGTQAIADSFQPTISANGRYIAFMSVDPHLAAGGIGSYDIFVRDRVLKKTTRIVANKSDLNTGSFKPTSSISADGRYIAFLSDGADLVPNDSNFEEDVFVYDTITKHTSRVSVASNGVDGTGGGAWRSPAISADGRYVAFYSFDNLVPDDTNSAEDVFVHDRATQNTTRISVGPGGTQVFSYLGNKNGLDISANGRYIAFISNANDLVFGAGFGEIDRNNVDDVFVYDRLTKTNSRISSTFDVFLNTGGYTGISISASGRYVAFGSFQDNSFLGDFNLFSDIYLYDRQEETIELISTGSLGVSGNGNSQLPVISADGNWVTFVSDASNLVKGDNNNSQDVFIYNRITKKTSLVSIDSKGIQANASSAMPAINADGRYIAFESMGSNLVTNDNNGINDIFIRDRLLDKTHQADLQVSVSQKPVSVAKNSVANFTFKITNIGPDTVGVLNIEQITEKGKVLSLIPSKGSCNSGMLSFCKMSNVSAGETVTLQASIKALDVGLRQQLSISSGGRDDPQPLNNHLIVNTVVTPVF